jgi:hypothetical protein
MSIEVTVRDTESGEFETATIENDYMIICAGTAEVTGTQVYPGKGTHVLTVRGVSR